MFDLLGALAMFVSTEADIARLDPKGANVGFNLEPVPGVGEFAKLYDLAAESCTVAANLDSDNRDNSMFKRNA